MGLVKTRRLAAMQKQTTYTKATVVRQRAKVETMQPPICGIKRSVSPRTLALHKLSDRFVGIKDILI